MPIITPEQVGQKTRPEASALPRHHVRMFLEARQARTRQEQRSRVVEHLSLLIADGRLGLTPILNEAEPYRTFALEHLTRWRDGVRVDGPNPFQLMTVRMKHRGAAGVDAEGRPLSPSIKVVTERVPLADNPDVSTYDSTGGVRHMRIYGDWMPQQEIVLPVEQALGMLFKAGWWVSPHLPLRIRRKYRMLVELAGDGLVVTGAVDRNGCPILEPERDDDAGGAVAHTQTAQEREAIAREAEAQLKMPPGARRTRYQNPNPPGEGT